jgi:hypothetical protein
LNIYTFLNLLSIQIYQESESAPEKRAYKMPKREAGFVFVKIFFCIMRYLTEIALSCGNKELLFVCKHKNKNI